MADMPAMTGRADRDCPRRHGSIFLLSYLLLLVLSGLMLPQTMRALSSGRLATRFVLQRSADIAAEASLDEAIRFLWDTPEFGNTADGDWVCVDPAWDCWDAENVPSPSLLPGIASVSVLAQNINSNPPSTNSTTGNWEQLKRVWITSTSIGGEATLYDAVVRVEERYGNNEGVRGLEKVTVGTGLLYEGNLTVHRGNKQAVVVTNGSEVRGKVTVGPEEEGLSGDHDLCCDRGSNADTIGLETTAGNMITSDGRGSQPAGTLIADNQNGHGDDLATDFNGVYIPLPSNEPDRPSRMGQVPVVNPLPMPTVCQPARELKGDDDGDGNGANGHGERIPLSDGTLDAARNEVTYCFESLEVSNASHGIFEAPVNAEGEIGSVRIVTRTNLPSGGDWSIRVGSNSKLYAVPVTQVQFIELDDPPDSPKPFAAPLTVSIPAGNTATAPATCPGTNGACGVFIDGGGGTLFGSIHAPEANVRIGQNTLVNPVRIDPETEARLDDGFVVGLNVDLVIGSQVLLGTPTGGPGDGEVVGVALRAWRRCLNADCSL